MTERRPNIVLMNCDDLGYGDLGCYGSARNTTPALDRMAAEGLRFDSFYMASPVCSPSRGAMLTGCYPPRIGFGTFDGLPVLFPAQGIGLAPTEITIARLLHDAGYRTQMIGKWHCGDQPDFMPTNHGFDHWFGIPYSNDMGRQVADPTWGFNPDYPPLPLVHGTEVVEQQPDQASLTERFVVEAVEFMRGCRDEPFFLYLAHIYVHIPIYVQDRFARASRNGRYGAAVECIDWAAAVILAELRALGLDDDTLVIFTSDNGSRARDEGGSNAPLRGVKGTTWEGGLRVPCIARWPGHIGAGRTSDELVTALDLYPTLAALAGAPVPTDRTIDGLDITALLLDPSVTTPRESFAYYWMNDLEAIRDRRWKLHFAKHNDTWPMTSEPVRKLYDLHSDPREAHDVLDEHPDVVARLEALADAVRHDVGDAGRGMSGRDTRAPGRVEHPVPLTTFDPEHPYYMAEYDLSDRG
jgi:arylsulfatase A-like enzyme